MRRTDRTVARTVAHRLSRHLAGDTLEDLRENQARWRAESGIGPEGALLVRPDQHVGRRAARQPDDPTTALRDAIAQIAQPRNPDER